MDLLLFLLEKKVCNSKINRFIVHIHYNNIKIETACEINVCLNNGFCSSNGTCLCFNGFYGDQCQICNRFKI